MGRRNNAIPRFSLFSFQDIITCITGILLLLTLMLILDLAQRSEASPRTQTPKIVEQLSAEQQQLDGQLEQLEDQIRLQTELLNSGALINADSLRSHVEIAKDRSQQLDREIEHLSEQQTRTVAQQQQLERRQQERAHEQDESRKLHEQIERVQQQLAEMQNSNRVFYNATGGSGRTPWLVEISQQQILAAQAGVIGPPQTFISRSEFLAWARQQSASSIQFVLLLKPDAVDEYDRIVKGLTDSGFAFGFDALRGDQNVIHPQTGAGGP